MFSIRRVLLYCSIGVAIFGLTACGREGDPDAEVQGAVNATLTAVAAEAAAPTATPVPPTATPVPPTATPLPPTPEPTPELDPAAAAVAVADFAATVWELDLTAASERGGIEAVTAFALDTDEETTTYWAAHTVGGRGFEPEQAHIVGVFSRSDDGNWHEVTSLELTDLGAGGETFAVPDFLTEGSGTQVMIEPSHVWLQIEGGAGAHGGTLNLLKFDGSVLTREVDAASASPGVGTVADINGDEFQELLLDATDPYVFCYACGVRQVAYTVMRWNGSEMETVELIGLEETGESRLPALNNRAVELAGVGLWKDAVETGVDGLALSVYDPNFDWNFALINLNAAAKRDAAEAEPNAYPLLHWMFYGDYDAAVETMRPYAPDEIFRLETPLIVGTAAEGWSADMATRILSTTVPALGVMPELAAAHYLQGWAKWLSTQDNDAAAEDVARAVALAPDDALYTASLTYLLDGNLPPAAAVDTEPPAADGAAGDADDGDPELSTAAPDLGSGRLFYSAQDADGRNAIFQISAGVATLVTPDAAQPAIQPGGVRLAFFSTRDDMLGLGGYDLDSKERLRFSFNTEDSYPTWDPSTEQLIFASTRFGDGKWRLYQVWADGRGDAVDLGFGQDPDWHPTDNLIVFKGCDDAGANCGLWTMRDDGSERQQLTDSAGDARPVWTPDGGTVVFMSDQRDGNWELYRVEVAGGVVTRLTDHPANDGLPAVNPTGTQIAFMSNRNDVWEILGIPSAGGAVVDLVTIGEDVADWLEQGVAWER